VDGHACTIHGQGWLVQSKFLQHAAPHHWQLEEDVHVPKTPLQRMDIGYRYGVLRVKQQQQFLLLTWTLCCVVCWHTSVGMMVAVVVMICHDSHKASLGICDLSDVPVDPSILERINVDGGDPGKHNIITSDSPQPLVQSLQPTTATVHSTSAVIMQSKRRR
jgi:hypothetical protein